jgi:hypothetical protein
MAEYIPGFWLDNGAQAYVLQGQFTDYWRDYSQHDSLTQAIVEKEALINDRAEGRGSNIKWRVIHRINNIIDSE